ncbi:MULTISPECIES: heme-binding domain-containing protein [Chryseobacterium]|uniref:Cytochrome C n=1 Tax=Chryseobacterium aquaticum subsp. greenlandense TaxID=345663 RepID=A0A101CHZ8_9FLAO|nr:MULTISPECIES: heme-binding domain-containing protein [Chryseobacterium]KNB61170.1 cytochrome C [Chryseobacterium sp. Hurlbut01]KUJ56365.1 cytochrome C [Chryseobacterium aquaticum subsp. greenlandense]
MRKILKRLPLILLAIFIVAQLFQPALNKEASSSAKNINISKVENLPSNVDYILRTSCFDCHSNNTNYEWYDFIQPGRIFVDDHVKKGKAVLNFDEWGNYSSRKQERLLNSIKSQLEEGKMPLESYLWLHKDAKIDSSKMKQLKAWLNSK